MLDLAVRRWFPCEALGTAATSHSWERPERPDTGSGVRHGIRDTSPADAHSLRGLPYMAPCRRSAGMAEALGCDSDPSTRNTSITVQNVPFSNLFIFSGEIKMKYIRFYCFSHRKLKSFAEFWWIKWRLKHLNWLYSVSKAVYIQSSESILGQFYCMYCHVCNRSKHPSANASLDIVCINMCAEMIAVHAWCDNCSWQKRKSSRSIKKCQMRQLISSYTKGAEWNSVSVCKNLTQLAIQSAAMRKRIKASGKMMIVGVCLSLFMESYLERTSDSVRVHFHFLSNDQRCSHSHSAFMALT